MEPLLRDVAWEACPIEPTRNRELEAMAKAAFGTVPSAVPFLAHAPWVCRVQTRLSYDVGLLVHLDHELADLASMVVSQQNSCRYCYGISRALLRILGKSEGEVLEIERRLSERVDEPRTAAAVAFARRMVRADPLPTIESHRPLLDQGLSREEIRELAFVVAFTEYANRTCTIAAIPPRPVEDLPDRWFVRLFRPFLASNIGRHRQPGRPEATPSRYDGPFAYLVSPFAGSPIGSRIAEALDEAWASPELTRRCKAFLFAVVAHALGCAHTARAAREVLFEEGFRAGEVDAALAHLKSPRFDTMERMLVPFARETVWYEPAPLQRRARTLLEHVTPAEFVSAVGFTALANALCRLAAATVDPR